MESKLRLKLTIAFLTLVILVDFSGMAIVVVLFPKLLIGDAGILSYWPVNIRYIAMGFLMAVYPLGQIFGAAALSKLSDYYGRKNILLMTLIGTLIGFALSGFAVMSQAIVLLFISRLISGLCAGNVAIAQAALLDVSTENTRVKNISWGQFAMGLGYIIGPLIGGILINSSLIKWFDMSTPFWFFCIVLVILITLAATIFSETNKTPKKERINILNSFAQIYSGLSNDKMKGIFGV
jgi:DHA1 family tetracycline resistance protein-like MFS transporter